MAMHCAMLHMHSYLAIIIWVQIEVIDCDHFNLLYIS